MSKAPKAVDCEPDKDWMAESDLRTLIEAEKVKGDKARFAAAMKKRDEMKKAITAIGKDA